MVEWTCPGQARPAYLGHRYPEPSCHVAFSMRFDEDTGASFFKLRVPVALKGQSRKTNVFLFIHPERVSALSQGASQEIPDAVRTAFPVLPTSAILQLQFNLAKPGAVVTPADTPLAPKSTATVNVLRLLRSLACATQFTVYLMNKGQLKPSVKTMCDMACAGNLKSDPSELRLETLYGGTGAKAVEGAELLFPFDDETVPESPPSYDELVGPPPPKARPKSPRIIDSSEPPRKRSRLRTTSSSPTPDGRWKQELQDMRDQLREEMRREMREELRQSDEQWQKKMQEMQNEMREEMQRHQAQHVDKLLELEQLIDERMERLREELLEEMGEVTDGTSGIVDARIDEQIMDVKDELRSYVAEEMKEVEDRIRDDFEDGSVSLKFTR